MEAFSLTYEGYDPDQEGLREVLTSSGNGRFCSRGAAEWEDADGVHYPGTYAHGVYNRETTILGGVPVLNEDLELEGRHLDPVSPRTFAPDVIALKVQTRQSGVYVSQAARTRVFAGQQPVAVARTLYQTEDYIQQVLAFELREEAPVRVEKMVTLATSRDPATSDTLTKAGTVALRRPDFPQDLARHIEAWEELWRVCDV